MIIANDTRSRRSWMNSLISIAPVRRQKPDRPLPLARFGAAAVIGNCPLRAAIRSMNTSSSDGSDFVQVEPFSLAIRRDGAFERGRVAPRDMQAVAERRDHVDAGLALQFVQQAVDILPLTS